MNNLVNLTDAQLINSYRNGDTEALGTLVLRYKDKIYTSIFHLVNDKPLAEDMFQDAIIKIIESFKNNTYADDGKFPAWAVRIAHNTCIDHFRKVKRRLTIKNIENYDIYEHLIFPETGVDQKMADNQSYSKVKEILGMLPNNDQFELVILHLYAGLTYKKISELKQCSINTLTGRMRYALVNIRKIIEKEEIAL